MRRGYSAAVDGPIAIDVGLFAQHGWVKVQVRADCPRAIIGLSTTDDHGPSADAVRDATVESGPDGRLITTIHGTRTATAADGAESGDTGAGMPGAAPVEITVVAPPGSSLVARTDSAHIGAIDLADVELKTASGNISVPTAGRVFAETTSGAVTIRRATDVTATSQSGAIAIGTSNRTTVRTASGDILLGAPTGDVTAKSTSGSLTIRALQGGTTRADTTSGAITIHATANATIRASTTSGDLTITATPTTNLNLQTTTTTGQVSVPPAGSGCSTSSAGHSARPAFTCSRWCCGQFFVHQPWGGVVRRVLVAQWISPSETWTEVRSLA